MRSETQAMRLEYTAFSRGYAVGPSWIATSPQESKDFVNNTHQLFDKMLE